MTYDLTSSVTLSNALQWLLDDGACPPCRCCDEPRVPGTDMCQACLDDHIEESS